MMTTYEGNMGAKESLAMKHARNLIIKKKMRAATAARIAGVTANAIYMAKWYKEWKKKNNPQ
jgi:hypothetical protein